MFINLKYDEANAGGYGFENVTEAEKLVTAKFESDEERVKNVDAAPTTS